MKRSRIFLILSVFTALFSAFIVGDGFRDVYDES